MTVAEWSYYALTVLVLMSTPGPSHLLMLSNSLKHGMPRALATAAGDLSANLLQMLAAAAGLAALVLASEHAFTMIKWLGVGYLLWLGLRMFRSSAGAPNAAAVTKGKRRHLWWQGFATSAANPKAVVFFAAFFPLFIRPETPLAPQFAILAGTYLAIDGLFLCAYGLGARWLASHLEGKGRRLLDRVAGSLIIVAALALASRTLPATR